MLWVIIIIIIIITIIIFIIFIIIFIIITIIFIITIIVIIILIIIIIIILIITTSLSSSLSSLSPTSPWQHYLCRSSYNFLMHIFFVLSSNFYRWCIPTNFLRWLPSSPQYYSYPYATDKRCITTVSIYSKRILALNLDLIFTLGVCSHCETILNFGKVMAGGSGVPPDKICLWVSQEIFYQPKQPKKAFWFIQICRRGTKLSN